MLLAIDVGNTSTVFGLFDDAQLTEHWRIATERHKSGDELGALYRSFLDLGRVDGICTSTNFDVVSADAEYIGGVLAPGIEISMDALFARAARLRKIDFVEPETVIGKTTVAALQSGVVYGFAGQVDGIVEHIRAELGAEAPTVATGGLADLIAPHARTIDRVDPFLTLDGLRLGWERNR